jgi:hypothetical protein
MIFVGVAWADWQNGHIESSNSRIRDEYLNGHLFESLIEAQVT